MLLLRRVALLILVVVGLLVGCGPEGDGGASAVRPVSAESVPRAVQERPAVRALEVLRRWDRLRAAAYASGEPSSLRRLYVPGSWAGARDVRNLRAYVDRGLVVRGLRMQVLNADVLPAAPGTLRVRVEERLARGTAVGGGSRLSLPTGRPTERVITLVRGQHGWQLRSVRRG